ncbi:MAG: hypothetical protein GXP05_08710 [Alphaproteobacteria bacterium]|nr:hypothetical protein [Alphaproteobacteria bacterium]
MQVLFHIGAHCTDEGQILACLAKNRAMLARQGIAVPPPNRFKPVLRDTLSVLKGEKANRDVEKIIFQSILDDEQSAELPQRLIFSNDAFLTGAQKVLGASALYPDAGVKCQKLFNLFHNHEVEFCLAIRNPATFLPALFHRIGANSFEAFIAQTDPMALTWSSVIARITEALPDVTLKVWSNEDTPFIWPELIHEIVDINREVPIKGIDDYLATIMLKEGLERMESYLQTHPPANEIQRRRILSAFLDKFEIDDPTLEVEAPIWTADYVETLTEIYEEDLFAIEKIPGVQFISP